MSPDDISLTSYEHGSRGSIIPCIFLSIQFEPTTCAQRAIGTQEKKCNFKLMKWFRKRASILKHSYKCVRKVKQNFKVKKPPKKDRNRPNVVVFDLDDTLCQTWRESEVSESKLDMRSCGESCYVNRRHYIIPHMKVLFDYLLSKNVRLVFYSASVESRNLPLVTDLMTYYYGQDKFLHLKYEGQFEIFSRTQSVKPGETSRNWVYPHGTQLKDLKVVLKPERNETINDVILVDDRPYNATVDQKVIITRSKHDFKNNTYYFLGVFKTYFTSTKYSKQSLRHCMSHILEPCYNYSSYHFPPINLK